MSSWRRLASVGIEEGGVGGRRVVGAVDLGIDIFVRGVYRVIFSWYWVKSGFQPPFS